MGASAKRGMDYGQACGGLYLTKKDWAMEVNVDSFYTIMENLTCALGLGCIYANLKESGILSYDNAVSKNTCKPGVYMTYSF